MRHEKLKVYQILISQAEDIAKMIANWPRGNANLADQIKRAIESSVFNLCEGNAKRSKLDRRRFFDISLGSLAEVAAGIDLARVFDLVDANKQGSIKSYLRLAYVKIKALP